MYNIQTDFTFHYLPQVFKWVNPRLVVSGHTHHGCHRIHDNGVPEWTVASFSWRNKKGPSFLLVCLFISWVSTLSVHSSTAKMRQIGILLTFGLIDHLVVYLPVFIISIKSMLTCWKSIFCFFEYHSCKTHYIQNYINLLTVPS